MCSHARGAAATLDNRPSAPSGGGSALGIVWLLLAAASIGGGTIAVKAAYSQGAQPDSLLVIRLVIAGLLALCAAPWLMAKASHPLPSRAFVFSAFAGIALVVGGRAEFEGLSRLPAAVLILLLYAAAIWVACIERLLWGRRLARRTASGIVIVLAGLAIMVGPFGASFDVIGVAAGLVASVASAGFLLLVTQSQEKAPVMLSGSIALVCAGACALLTYPGAVPAELEHGDNLLYIAAIGVAQYAFVVFVALGLHLTTTIAAAVVLASEPVFVAVLAVPLLGEALAMQTLVGGIVVLGGVLLTSTQGAPTPPSPRV